MRNHKWIVLSAAWLGFFTSSLTRLLVPSILPTLRQVFEMSGRQAGFLTTSYWAGYAVFQIPGGLVADRYGPRRTLIAGTALTALLALTAAQSQNYEQLAIMQLLLGSASAFIWAPGMVLLLHWFEPHERATASGFFNMAFPAGATTSLVVSTFIVQSYGSWQAPFLVYAVALGLSAVIGYALIRNRQRRKYSTTFKTYHIRGTLAKREIWYDSFARFGSGFAYLGVASWATSFLVSTYQTTLAQAGAIGASMAAVGVFSYPIAGLISDRVFKRRALTIFIGVVGIGLLTIILGFNQTGSLSTTLAVLPMLGFCYGIYGAPSASIVSEFDLKAEGLGFATSFVNFMTQAGGALSPTIFGLILDISGTYDPAWFILGLVALIFSIGPMLLVREGY